MRSARFWRVLAGAAILALLAGFGALLVPHYARNMQFTRSLGRVAAESSDARTTDALVRVRVMDQAARLGLPVREEQIRLKRSPGRLGIDVLYVVPIDLPLYSVDLHFHPSAGSR